jgi:hypothetical protein
MESWNAFEAVATLRRPSGFKMDFYHFEIVNMKFTNISWQLCRFSKMGVLSMVHVHNLAFRREVCRGASASRVVRPIYTRPTIIVVRWHFGGDPLFAGRRLSRVREYIADLRLSSAYQFQRAAAALGRDRLSRETRRIAGLVDIFESLTVSLFICVVRQVRDVLCDILYNSR